MSLNVVGNVPKSFYFSMMQWKIKEYGEELVKAWGYDISKYVEDDAAKEDGKPWYASKWSEDKWAEKKKMMEAFEETGMKNIFKDMMTEDFMEDLGEFEKYINTLIICLDRILKFRFQSVLLKIWVVQMPSKKNSANGQPWICPNTNYSKRMKKLHSQFPLNYQLLV